MSVLLVHVSRVIPPVVVLELEGPSNTVHPQSILPSEPVSPHPLSFSIGWRGIWNFMLERDNARWLHSYSLHEVAQLKAYVDYL